MTSNVDVPASFSSGLFCDPAVKSRLDVLWRGSAAMFLLLASEQSSADLRTLPILAVSYASSTPRVPARSNVCPSLKFD